jgi:putative ABC transport system substrate-binding protein
MNRRALITLLGGAAAGSCIAWPFAAHAQQQPKSPRRVVVLSPVRNPALDLFRAHLRVLGYVEGRDIMLDFRTTDGHVDRLPALAQELVREGAVDAIVVESTAAATAARQATRTIPIVAYIAVDPVAAGLAASLAHPGGNVTGVSFLAAELNAKRIELLHQVAPRATRLAAISAMTSNAANSPGNLRAIQDAARKLALTVEIITISDPARLRQELSAAALAGFDGFVLVPDVVLTAHIAEVVALLEASGRPAIYSNRIYVEAGGLISYSQDVADSYRRLASQLDRVLKGAAPSDIPFERPAKFELVVNLRTARRLGINLPPEVLALADAVIE